MLGYIRWGSDNYEHITVDDPASIYRALELFESARIDFADAMLCAKKQLEGYVIPYRINLPEDRIEILGIFNQNRWEM